MRGAGCVARGESAGLGCLGRGAGAGGQRVPATRALPGHMLAAPSFGMSMTLSPTLSRHDGGTRGRLRVSPGPLRCFPCPPAPAPRADAVAAPLSAGSRGWRDRSVIGELAGRWWQCTEYFECGVARVGRWVARSGVRVLTMAVLRGAGRSRCSLRGARGRRAREQREDPGFARSDGATSTGRTRPGAASLRGARAGDASRRREASMVITARRWRVGRRRGGAFAGP